MDCLYTGDIPKDYHYAIIYENYIDLYNQNVVQNIDLPYYRVYFNAPSFIYSKGITHFDTTMPEFTNIEVTDKWYYRKDCLNILIFTVVVALTTFWLVNLFTSIFKKGGLLSGLF